MRRKAKTYYPIWEQYNVLDDVSPQKFQLVGAIALEWNFLEDMVDNCVYVGLQLQYEVYLVVISRINGPDGKFEIIKKVARHHVLLYRDEAELICSAIGNISTLKTFRDFDRSHEAHRPEVRYCPI